MVLYSLNTGKQISEFSFKTSLVYRVPGLPELVIPCPPPQKKTTATPPTKKNNSNPPKKKNPKPHFTKETNTSEHGGGVHIHFNGNVNDCNHVSGRGPLGKRKGTSVGGKRGK